MPHPDSVPDYTSRSNAIREYGRSKSSFIRDVDEAFKNGNVEFLESIRVYFNDGSFIEGPDATEDTIQSSGKKQPRVYFKTALLESRYWESPNNDMPSYKRTNARKQVTEEQKPAQIKLTDASDLQQLQHEFALARQKNEAKDEQIERLKADKQFLQEELENRRGEIDKLRMFFDSVGGAAGSAAQLKNGQVHIDDGRAAETEVIDADVKDHTSSEEGAEERSSDWWQKHTPTFHRWSSRIAKSIQLH